MIGWIIYGIVIGLIVKIVTPWDEGDAWRGFLPTMALGIIGSILGGFLSRLVGFGSSFVFAIIGGLIFSYIIHYYQVNK